MNMKNVDISWSGSSPEAVAHPGVYAECKRRILKKVDDIGNSPLSNTDPVVIVSLSRFAAEISLPTVSKLRLRILSICGSKIAVDAKLAV